MPEDAQNRFEATRPHPARVYDCLLDGKDNYPVDQEVADELARRWPEIRLGTQENRAWMHRVVRRLATEHGVRQFLDIGTGIPTSPNLHEIAQEAAPAARVVYVDNDPVVLAHAQALLTPVSAAGTTSYVQADLRDPAAVLASEEVRGTLDFSKPIGLTLVAIMHFLEDAEDPYDVVATLVDALPTGSYVALSHACGDAAPASAAEAAVFYRERGVSAPVVPRSVAGIERFFDGLELLDPGVVPVNRWDEDPERRLDEDVWFFGGLGRKHRTS
ncbi:SAM-dependent methyltransferase [Streptomyces xiaopingdaonensis]|uniref:SAM-dependent methyltransferase n=1 Tax=Streptomyces xiaopingdaonensis TaxID=1565415 RepID=UPI0002F8B19E|nr:SAM-dependent methyltransferase [Streptomyces xiaopingdaonensis]